MRLALLLLSAPAWGQLVMTLDEPLNGLTFPPQGKAYRENAAAHRIWRRIQVEAPDVIVVRNGDLSSLRAALAGVVPVVEKASQRYPKSALRVEFEKRMNRTPRQVADELALVYGHELKDPVYIPAVALMARLRLGSLSDVERIVMPFVSGERDSLAKATGSHFSGHLLFADLYRMTGKQVYLDRVKAAAGMAFSPSGEPLEAMPLHNEMSDAVFMSAPILARAGEFTKEAKYFDMAARHLLFMEKLCLRGDGLYRHSPLNEAAWGRGNAFPALGLALTLESLPKSHAAYARTRKAFENLMAALAKHQDHGNGMWRQVVDHAEAWHEFTSTAMIGVAMQKGVRNGWLAKGEYEPRIARAWNAIKARTFTDGRVMDVCESTGKMKSLDDYLMRHAIFDRDARGGAMALLFATEMMK